MVKVEPGWFLVASLLFVSHPGYGQERKGLEAGQKRREVALGIGAAATTGKPSASTPTINLTYLAKTSKYSGSHWEVAIGTGESYGGIAWQFDIWPLDFARVGAGLGIVPFLDAMPGNPILVPMPEISAGFHFHRSGFAYSAGGTANLAYGARANAGIGFSF